MYFRKLFDLVRFPVAVNVGFVKHAWAFPKTTEPTMGSDRLTFYSFFIFQDAGMEISNSGGISWLVMEDPTKRTDVSTCFQSKANRGTVGRLPQKTPHKAP